MRLRMDSARSSFLVAAALLLYLFWILDALAIQYAWMIFIAMPALVPVRPGCLAAMAVIITASCVTFLLLSGDQPSFNSAAVAVTCAAIPATMMIELRRGALLSSWFVNTTPGSSRLIFVAQLRRACKVMAVVLLIPLISRDHPAEIAIPFAIALWITACALPGTAPRPRDPRAMLVNGVLMATSIALGLVALELGVRRIIPPRSTDVGMLQPDPEAIFRLRPSRSAHLHFPADDGSIDSVHAEISAQGLRDRVYGPKQPGEYRILLIGDSFTYGQTVEFADTIGQQLETLLRRDEQGRKHYVVNLGIPATGPWQQQIFLERIGFGLEPDLVIHQLFLGNDPHDTLARDERYLRLFSNDWAAELQRLRMLGTRRFRAEQWLADHSRAYLAFRDALGRDTVTRFLARGCRLFPRLKTRPIPMTKLIPPTWEVNNAEWYPELQDAMDSLVNTLCAIRDACAARGIGYAVYAVPIAEEVVPGWYEYARTKHRVSAIDQFEMGKGQRYLDAQLAAHGIDAIPVPERLKAEPAPERLYLKVDGHTTAAGNAAIARSLYDYLSSRTAVP